MRFETCTVSCCEADTPETCLAAEGVEESAPKSTNLCARSRTALTCSGLSGCFLFSSAIAFTILLLVILGRSGFLI